MGSPGPGKLSVEGLRAGTKAGRRAASVAGRSSGELAAQLSRCSLRTPSHRCEGQGVAQRGPGAWPGP